MSFIIAVAIVAAFVTAIGAVLYVSVDRAAGLDRAPGIAPVLPRK